MHKLTDKEQKEINEKELHLNSDCNIRKMQLLKQKEKDEKKYFSDCANYICEVKNILNLFI